jgi:hypothetical protein
MIHYKDKVKNKYKIKNKRMIHYVIFCPKCGCNITHKYRKGYRCNNVSCMHEWETN